MFYIFFLFSGKAQEFVYIFAFILFSRLNSLERQYQLNKH